MARRIPISRFRSVTDTYMMFMTPIPPTNREIAVIAIRNIVIPVTISSIREAILGQAITILSENHPEVKGTFKENDQDQQLQQQMVIACPKIASRSAPSRTLILMPLIAFVFANLLYDSREVKGTFKENDQDQQLQQQMEEMVTGMTMFLMAITAISLLVGGIGVMNIMYSLNVPFTSG
jgi:ABC-type antimicrobial peptide transport system permease subunit